MNNKLTTPKKMNIELITIEEDGWVWAKNREHEMGLGDLGVDVHIIDRRDTHIKAWCVYNNESKELEIDGARGIYATKKDLLEDHFGKIDKTQKIVRVNLIVSHD